MPPSSPVRAESVPPNDARNFRRSNEDNRPSPNHLPIARYVTPDEFAMLKVEALKLGFRHVESGPLVRSSYHAASQVPARAAAG